MNNTRPKKLGVCKFCSVRRRTVIF